MASTLVSLNQLDMSGRTMRGCPHMAAWFPVFTRFCIFRGHIKNSLDVWQAAGNAAASAGTHAWGDCLDTTQRSDAFIADAREAGARASWARITKYGWTGDQHAHLKLSCGCDVTKPDGTVSPAAYQVRAVDDGFNGLGWMGRKGPDYHPRPSTRRDYKSGIEWMVAQMTPTAIPATTPQEDDMPTPADLWSHEIPNLAAKPDPRTGKYPMARADFVVGQAYRQGLNASTRADAALRASLANAGKLAALSTAVQQMAGGGLDMAAIESAVRDAVGEAIASIEADVTVKVGA